MSGSQFCLHRSFGLYLIVLSTYLITFGIMVINIQPSGGYSLKCVEKGTNRTPRGHPMIFISLIQIVLGLTLGSSI